MKIFASVVAFATMIALAPAMAFLWSVSSAISFDGANIVSSGLYDTANPNVHAQLVYLGTDNVFTIVNGVTTDEQVGAAETPMSGNALVNGRITSKSYREDMNHEYNDGGTVSNGATYGLMITYVAADGKTWYNYSSNTYTISGLSDDASDLSDASFSFNWETYDGPLSSYNVGDGWVIPEPMTVLCGLAGLALLLKRRA